METFIGFFVELLRLCSDGQFSLIKTIILIVIINIIV